MEGIKSRSAASDADGDNLAYALLSVPAHGSLAGIAPNLTYTPGPDYSGSDSFRFRANDGQSHSAAAISSLSTRSAEV